MEGERNLYYFISDIHLGVCCCNPREHEAKFVKFLSSLPKETKSLYLLGDIFDFWYEWKLAIPRGHTRALGKLAEIADSGVKIYMFKGNHDLWLYDYFQSEIGVTVLEQPSVVEIEGKRFCMGHGDGLGNITLGFRFIRWAFYNPVLQFFFSGVHPRWSLALGYAWASHSRKIKTGPDNVYKFQGKESCIYKFADDFGQKYALSNGSSPDYYIFGHFHTPGEIDIPSGGHLVVLGDWIEKVNYAVFDGRLLKFETRP